MRYDINNKKEIEDSILKIIYDNFDVKIEEDFIDKPLLGKEIKLPARSLVYLYFEIKDFFDVKISEDDIVGGKFISVNSIADCIISNAKNDNEQ